jgi:hypothetical protein
MGHEELCQGSQKDSGDRSMSLGQSLSLRIIGKIKQHMFCATKESMNNSSLDLRFVGFRVE